MISKNLLPARSTLLAVILIFTVPGFCIGESSKKSYSEKEKLLEMIQQQSRQLEEQQKSLLAQEQQFQQYREKMQKEFANQQKRIEELKALVSPNAPTQGTQAQNPASQSTQKIAAVPASTTPKKKTEKIQPVGTPPESTDARRPLEIAAIFDQPGVLTPKGSLNLEPSFLYSYSSSDRIALVGYTIIPAITIGLIDVRSISRETYVTSLAARYGLTNRIELEARIPYVYRNESASTSPFATASNITDSSADGDGIGDIDFGVRYQMNRQTVGGPSFIASLRVKTDSGTGPFDVSYDPNTNLYTESPTGSGFWGVQPGLTAIFPTDPAVFFGSINYMWNIEKDVGTVDNVDYGDFDPGDSYGFSFGMGLALNEKASFSLGYEHTVIMKNKLNGETIAGEQNIQVGILTVGYSYLVRDDLSVIFSLGAGLTDAAPDVQLTVKAPYNVF